MGFIEVNIILDTGRAYPYYINTDHIIRIAPSTVPTKSWIYTKDDNFLVAESYDNVAEKIKAVQLFYTSGGKIDPWGFTD